MLLDFSKFVQIKPFFLFSRRRRLCLELYQGRYIMRSENNRNTLRYRMCKLLSSWTEFNMSPGCLIIENEVFRLLRPTLHASRKLKKISQRLEILSCHFLVVGSSGTFFRTRKMFSPSGKSEVERNSLKIKRKWPWSQSSAPCGCFQVLLLISRLKNLIFSTICTSLHPVWSFFQIKISKF